ncbi:MAG: LacI family DNA-binding transcriptional regulator [Eubacteriales bacterium]|nr:LacI family DNA-binding transcriptional regulator [Eubacteriales bacterium]
MITIKDIAERAGVSYATVSRALNGRSDVSEVTRQRIFELAREMGYQPNAIARSLVRRKSDIIAVVVPDVSNPFFADITMAVNAAADEAGFTTMICNTGWDPVKEQEKLRIMVEQRVEGIILKPTAFIRPGALEALNLPVVLFWHAMPDDLSYIEVDHEAGARLAVNHLIERGYRRIAYVGGIETSPSNQIRLMAYQKTLQEHGLAVDTRLISYGPFRQESGYARIAELLKTAKPPDAVFCGNDIIAIGVLQYAREHDVAVPADLGIIGFDDIGCASLPLVGLSTVSQPRDKLGREALQALMREIDTFPARGRQRILIEPELKVRDTT